MGLSELCIYKTVLGLGLISRAAALRAWRLGCGPARRCLKAFVVLYILNLEAWERYLLPNMIYDPLSSNEHL